MGDDLRAAADRLMRVYAEGYLAERPADDREPVTEGWLQGMKVKNEMENPMESW